MIVNPFSISSLLLAIICPVIVLILGLYGKTPVQKIWLFFNIAVGVWSLIAFLISQIQSDPVLALTLWRIADVSVAFITGIFVFVYSLVLGIPFAIAFGLQSQLQSLIGTQWWIAPLVTSTVLATIGPFIYIYLQRKAENRLLYEQRRYQMALREASAGLSRIKDGKKLERMVVSLINSVIALENCALYLYHAARKKFVLGASRATPNSQRTTDGQPEVAMNSAVVKFFQESKEPLVYDGKYSVKTC